MHLLKRKIYTEKVLVKQELSIYYLVMILVGFPGTTGTSVFREEKLTRKAPESGRTSVGGALPFGLFYQSASGT